MDGAPLHQILGTGATAVAMGKPPFAGCAELPGKTGGKRDLRERLLLGKRRSGPARSRRCPRPRVHGSWGRVAVIVINLFQDVSTVIAPLSDINILMSLCHLFM